MCDKALLSKTNQIMYRTWGWDSFLRMITYSFKVLGWGLTKSGNPLITKKLLTIGGAISEYRTITRFSGLPDTAEAFIDLINERKSKDPDTYTVEFVQNLSLIFYYGCEHLAWFKDHKIVSGDSDRLWRMSSQAWGVWIILELYLCWKRYKTAKTEKEKNTIALSILKNLSDMVLAYHWSVKKSPISDLFIGIFGVIGSVVGLKKLYAP